jgi:hypothetical protein
MRVCSSGNKESNSSTIFSAVYDFVVDEGWSDSDRSYKIIEPAPYKPNTIIAIVAGYFVKGNRHDEILVTFSTLY